MEQRTQEELEKYFIPRYEFEIKKNEIYKDINKKTEANRDKILSIDEKHTENFYQLQRNLDQYVRSTDSLNESVKSLNDSVNKMSDSLSSNIENLRNIENRVGLTESTLSETSKAEQERKAAMIKFFTVIITSILGSGGLLTWLGPLLFGR